MTANFLYFHCSCVCCICAHVFCSWALVHVYGCACMCGGLGIILFGSSILSFEAGCLSKTRLTFQFTPGNPRHLSLEEGTAGGPPRPAGIYIGFWGFELRFSCLGGTCFKFLYLSYLKSLSAISRSTQLLCQAALVPRLTNRKETGWTAQGNLRKLLWLPLELGKDVSQPVCWRHLEF